MLELVTIEQAREHLRLDSDSDGGADDGWLAMFIPAASEAVALWRAGEPLTLDAELYAEATKKQESAVMDDSWADEKVDKLLQLFTRRTAK